MTRRQPNRAARAPASDIVTIEPAPRHSSSNPRPYAPMPLRACANGTSGAQADMPNPTTKNARRVAVCSRLAVSIDVMRGSGATATPPVRLAPRPAPPRPVRHRGRRPAPCPDDHRRPCRRPQPMPRATSSTALNRPVRSCDTPTTMLALPSAVDTSATTPLPSCLPIASARPFRSRAGTSPRLRAASFTPFTSSTSAAPPPVASLRCRSATWRSSRRTLSCSRRRRAPAHRPGWHRSAPATSFSRRCVSATTASANAPVTASMRRTPAATARLRQDLEIADIAGAPHMRAAAQFDRIGRLVALAMAHRDDAHLFAVFLAEQRHRAHLDRGVRRHQPRASPRCSRGCAHSPRPRPQRYRRRSADAAARCRSAAGPAHSGCPSARHACPAAPQRLVQQVRRRMMRADRRCAAHDPPPPAPACRHAPRPPRRDQDARTDRPASSACRSPRCAGHPGR